MPEAPPAPPPAPAAAALAPAAPSSAPPPNLIDPLPTPGTPPRPGSARERMRKETSAKWGEEPAAPEPTKPSAPAKPTPKPEDAPERPGEETPPPPPPEEAPAGVTPEQKKKNPWVLVREKEKQIKALEEQISQTKAGSLAEKEKSEYQERIEKAEKRIKEKEDELRFKSYEKSDEFNEKYEKPYVAAWEKHMADLRGVTVTGDDGVARDMKEEDILDLVNLSLPDARQLADDKWGRFANEAMLARKEIRDLFETKNKALETARKSGAEREKTFEENRKKWVADVQKHIADTWEEANQTAFKHPTSGEFFQPVEGDDKRNELLTKGYAMVDAAFAKNAMDPNLTPEERAEVVRKHAAVRNKAASWSVLKLINSRLRTEIDALKKANAQFKGSQPPAGGGTSQGGGGQPGGSARDRMHSAGDKYAK